MIFLDRRKLMKHFRGFTLGLLLGVGMAFSGLAFAQNAADQNKKTESCCAMESCLCKGDSCPMMKGGKKDASKNHSEKREGCCCCGGDSCDMKTKEVKTKDVKDTKAKP